MLAMEQLDLPDFNGMTWELGRPGNGKPLMLILYQSNYTIVGAEYCDNTIGSVQRQARNIASYLHAWYAVGLSEQDLPAIPGYNWHISLEGLALHNRVTLKLTRLDNVAITRQAKISRRAVLRAADHMQADVAALTYVQEHKELLPALPDGKHWDITWSSISDKIRIGYGMRHINEFELVTPDRNAILYAAHKLAARAKREARENLLAYDWEPTPKS